MHGYSSGQKEQLKKSWHFSLKNDAAEQRDYSYEVPFNEKQLDCDGAVTLQVVQEY